MRASRIDSEFETNGKECQMPLNWGQLKNGLQADNFEPRTIFSTLEG